jgi:hypothetical protein
MTKGNKTKTKKSKILFGTLIGIITVVAAVGGLYFQFRGEFLSKPHVEVRVTKLSVYSDFRTPTATPIPVFYPWMGLEAELTNHGRQLTTLRNFRVMVYYRPLQRWVPSGFFYMTDTKAQDYIDLEPGAMRKTHITFNLGLSLSENEKNKFLGLLENAKKLHDLFGGLYLEVFDGLGNKFVSYEFFTQGPEMLVTTEGLRSKMAITYVRRGETNVINILDRDAERQKQPSEK